MVETGNGRSPGGSVGASLDRPVARMSSDPARPPGEYRSVFASFFMAGFECSSHRRGDGVRLDLIRATAHD
ncbi:MAG: hypothetical protein EOQ99_33560, partial [Mesorhizobium sp.]